MSTDRTNPYHPPRVELNPTSRQESQSSYPEASKSARVANLVFDNVCCLFLVMVILILFEVTSPGSLQDTSDPVVDQLLSWATMLVYYIGFEAAFGRTPGKFITGTLVLTSEGTKPTLGQIIGRTFSRFVPFDPFSFLGGDRGWHDKWSGTCVVKTRRDS
jgi:uncharacterized RDD family membrane protein YckC